MGKASRLAAAIVRGLDTSLFRDGSVRELIRPPAEDLFR
jgi:F420-0:gamma-glutamyl ligase